MTDRDKILAIALLMGLKPIVRPRSIQVTKWKRRFLTDVTTGDITAVQDVIPIVDGSGNHQYRYETVARAEAV